MKTITYLGPAPSVDIAGTSITALRGVPVAVPSAIAEKLLLQSNWKSAEGEEIPPPPPAEEDVITVTNGGFTLGPNHHRVFANAQSASFNKPVKLPSAPIKGKEYVVENTATNNNMVTVEALEGQIEGPSIAAAASIKIGKSEGYSSIAVVWDGTNWHVV